MTRLIAILKDRGERMASDMSMGDLFEVMTEEFRLSQGQIACLLNIDDTYYMILMGLEGARQIGMRKFTLTELRKVKVRKLEVGEMLTLIVEQDEPKVQRIIPGEGAQ